MSSRIEILNEGGFRSDGRRQYELRDITIDMYQQGSADGAATVHHGLTQVEVQVFGPREAKMRSQTIHDRANINVEIIIAPFSTGDRRRRGKSDKRTLEMATTIKETFEPIVQTSLYPRSQIDIYVTVLQQDGGLLAACINGTTLALAAAGVPLTDLVCAVSVGTHGPAPLLDLTTLEENDVPHTTVASLPRSGRLSLVTMETRLHVDRFEEIFTLAGEAGNVVYKEMRAKIKARAGKLVNAMSMAGLGAGRTGGDLGGREVYDDRMDEL